MATLTECRYVQIFQTRRFRRVRSLRQSVVTKRLELQCRFARTGCKGYESHASVVKFKEDNNADCVEVGSLQNCVDPEHASEECGLVRLTSCHC